MKIEDVNRNLTKLENMVAKAQKNKQDKQKNDNLAATYDNTLAGFEAFDKICQEQFAPSECKAQWLEIHGSFPWQNAPEGYGGDSIAKPKLFVGRVNQDSGKFEQIIGPFEPSEWSGVDVAKGKVKYNPRSYVWRAENDPHE